MSGIEEYLGRLDDEAGSNGKADFKFDFGDWNYLFRCKMKYVKLRNCF